jgi:dolichol-phosphate mannosyltransferase
MSSSACVVIPTLNEAAGINEIIERIRLNTDAKWIIVVDDGSTDGTIEAIQKRQLDDQLLFLIVRTQGKNFAKSYIEGFQRALQIPADIIIQIDADGSHDPMVINKLIEALDSNDFAVGSRYVKGGDVKDWNKQRLAISRLGNFYFRTLVGLPIKDITGGYNAWRAETLRNIDFDKLECNGYVFQLWLKWLAYSKGYKFKEIPITFTERKAGNSKFNWKIMLESAIDAAKIKFFK